MSIPRKSKKEVALAIVVLAAVAAWASTAWAQFGGDAVTIVGDTVTLSVADAAAEQSLGDIDTWTSQIDTSVTTGGGGGNYTPNAQTIATLDQTLFPNNGVNAQNFATIFPGWQSCAPDCTDAGKVSDQAKHSVISNCA